MKPITAFLVIILWSFAVHIPGLNAPLLDYHAYRQCQTASMARNYVRHGMHFLNPEVDTAGLPVRAATEFPIYSYLLALLFRFFGEREIYGRLLSSFFAAWGAIYLWAFIRPRLGGRIALWSALVMCSIPVHIYFTRSVQPEPMALWGFLGFLYYADRWLHRGGKSRAWIMALLMGAIGPLLKLPMLYLVIPLWGYLGYERFGRQLFSTFRWMMLMTGILALTGAWYLYAKTAPTGVLPLSTKEHLANLAPIFTWRLWRAQFISRIPELVITYSGLLLGGIGIYYFRKAKAFRLVILWSSASVVYVALLGEYGLIHRYTLLPLAPLSAVLIACGISMFWEQAKVNVLLRALAVLLILGIPLHAALRIKHWYRLEYSYLSQAHDTLAKISRPTDLVLVVTHEIPQHLYYLDRYGYGIEPATWHKEDVQQMIACGVRYIFIPVDDNRKRLTEWKSLLSRQWQRIEETPDYILFEITG